MKTVSFFTCLFTIVLLACTDKGKRISKDPDAIQDSALVIGNPMDAGLDNILLFPVGANYKPLVVEGVSRKIGLTLNSVSNGSLYDKNASSEYVNQNENEFDIRNLLFYNQLTGVSYPLSSDTLHILSFAIHKEFSKPLIIYRIVKTDYNGDSVFNSSDPVIFYVSDLMGKDFTQVTASDEQFEDYFYYPKNQTLLIKTSKDSNHDLAFSNSDETNFRELKINAPAFGREIFPASLKDSLRFK